MESILLLSAKIRLIIGLSKEIQPPLVIVILEAPHSVYFALTVFLTEKESPKLNVYLFFTLSVYDSFLYD